ncbi:MAG: sulfatase-like hydrolase/transferase [Phycisphaerae bacterium]|nr:sulfatase-like hydrolase/transferase [Phycisphaerae bacterium]NIP55405.1 sulfatase-like hydrolase/transferase [Phycisphaerae bacterium]NIS54075.1 sulfatase-like hydrolase/transferase [Phycisphaerae bacterium]NIU11718.1 sulfatase-like hydrolase/transferase [Phycisphaerae bacterium]NIU59533.1 sulfatase-like hydrolase/transferase [Phycisphaerae bacterium]
MKRRDFLKFVGIGAASSLLRTSPTHAKPGNLPNIVLIMTDNHSPWTLGCYGNREILTPNIDRLAREGTLFTRCFSSNAVCSPTRATYLTGLMPSQHGVHCYLRGGGAQIGPDACNTIGEFQTLPEILHNQGYVCGLSGKWHLGDNLNPQEGFTYWITKPHGHTSTFYNAKIIENGQIRQEPTYLTDFWTDHGIRFIEKNKDRPFFLFLAYNGPYGLGNSLRNNAKNRHAKYYADKELKSFPREPIHPWLRNNRQYINNLTAIHRYAAEVSGVDDGVGRILQTLKRLGLKQNTLVIFTADQGLCGGHHGMWGMGDHSRPLHTYDETCHVPLIFRHPAAIPAGKKLDLMVSNYDFMSTVLSYLGAKDRLPDKPPSPGRDYSAALRGQRLNWDNIIFYEFENSRMVRTSEWKYTRRFPDGPDELYDLTSDAGERHNLVNKHKHAGIQKRLAKKLDEFFNRYADPKYDLWRGGRSKTYLLTSPKKPLR